MDGDWHNPGEALSLESRIRVHIQDNALHLRSATVRVLARVTAIMAGLSGPPRELEIRFSSGQRALSSPAQDFKTLSEIPGIPNPVRVSTLYQPHAGATLRRDLTIRYPLGCSAKVTWAVLSSLPLKKTMVTVSPGGCAIRNLDNSPVLRMG